MRRICTRLSRRCLHLDMYTIPFNPRATSLAEPHAVDTAVFVSLEKDITYTFAGKSALALLLRYYRAKGSLRDRSDQVLVPQWLGGPVYNIMQYSCFPNASYNEKVRGLLLYHQWGFPQDVDAVRDFCEQKKLFLIEDCAHALESYYKGQRVGTFGEVAFFSLQKFFPSVVGGAVYSTQRDVHDFLEGEFKKDDEELAKEIFANCFAVDTNSTKRNWINLERNYIVYDRILKCPSYALAVARAQMHAGALDKRRAHYELYKQAFGAEKYLSQFIQENVVPWVVPLFFDEDRCARVAAMLKRASIESGVYHFDVNRNMLEPDFKLCVPVPCHQGMSEEDVGRVIGIVKEAVR